MFISNETDIYGLLASLGDSSDLRWQDVAERYALDIFEPLGQVPDDIDIPEGVRDLVTSNVGRLLGGLTSVSQAKEVLAPLLNQRQQLDWLIG